MLAVRLYYDFGCVGQEEMFTHMTGIPCNLKEATVWLSPVMLNKYGVERDENYVVVSPGSLDPFQRCRSLNRESWKQIVAGIKKFTGLPVLQTGVAANRMDTLIEGAQNVMMHRLEEQTFIIANAKMFIG